MTKQELITILTKCELRDNAPIFIQIREADGSIDNREIVSFAPYSDALTLITNTSLDIDSVTTEEQTDREEVEDEPKCGDNSELWDSDGFDTDGTEEDEDNEEFECASSKQLRALLKGHKWNYDNCCDTNNHNHYLKKGDCVVYISTKHSAMSIDDDMYHIGTMIVDRFDFDGDCAARGIVGEDWYGWNTDYAPGLTYYRLATAKERADFLNSVPSNYRNLIKGIK